MYIFDIYRHLSDQVWVLNWNQWQLIDCLLGRFFNTFSGLTLQTLISQWPMLVSAQIPLLWILQVAETHRPFAELWPINIVSFQLIANVLDYADNPLRQIFSLCWKWKIHCIDHSKIHHCIWRDMENQSISDWMLKFKQVSQLYFSYIYIVKQLNFFSNFVTDKKLFDVRLEHKIAHMVVLLTHNYLIGSRKN